MNNYLLSKPILNIKNKVLIILNYLINTQW